MSGRPTYEDLLKQVADLEEQSSKLRITEEALRLNEGKYRDLYDNAPNAYFSVSAIDGSILRCNKAALRLLGYGWETMRKMKATDLYADTPDGIGKAQKILNRFSGGESIRNEELQMRDANGKVIWINLSVEPVRDRDGNITESRSIVTDISDRYRAQDEIKAANDQLKEVNKKCLDAYALMRDWKDRLSEQLQGEVVAFLLNKDGIIIGVTQRGLDVTSLKRVEIMGSHILDLLIGESKGTFKNVMSNALVAGFLKIEVCMIHNRSDTKNYQAKLMHMNMNGEKTLLVLMQVST